MRAAATPAADGRLAVSSRIRSAPVAAATGSRPVMLIERTDFYSVPVQDMARAKAFYRDTLGMRSPNWDAPWPEIETGNVSLYLINPASLGREFVPHIADVALRVADVAQARSELEARGVEFDGDIRDTGVCHMTLFRDSEGNQLMLHHRYAG
jgi:predicted enzyme related to lactoylglutathione lyase